MMFWFVVILAIAFLILGPNDHQLRCSAANVLAGAAGHIDSSVDMSGDVERDAEPTSKPLQKNARDYTFLRSQRSKLPHGKIGNAHVVVGKS